MAGVGISVTEATTPFHVRLIELSDLHPVGITLSTGVLLFIANPQSARFALRFRIASVC